ncbi:hypothetical protein [Acidocella sp.]|jgi:hypothetical protein|uniref:hypothetical protein n=1 Tax=Acidocella sp. TaxID=50710 RepID=UPI002F423DD1
MRNPLMKKNPFMSIWLSNANRAFSVGSGLWKAEARRQQKAAVAETNRLITSFWADVLKTPRTRNRRKPKS